MSTLWSLDGGARRAASIDMPSVKVLVVGETGVGKSMLTTAICGGDDAAAKGRSNQWTVGADVQVLIHANKAGTPHEQDYFVELFDIGGSRSHRSARGVFYDKVAGIILVHDLSNKKSTDPLKQWLNDIVQHSSLANDAHNMSGATSPIMGQRTHNQSWLPTSVWETSTAMLEGARIYNPDKDVPVLVVGTKANANQSSPNNNNMTRIATECHADELWLDCRKPISAGSTNRVKLARFFDRVIEESTRGDYLRMSPMKQIDRRRRFDRLNTPNY